MIEQTLKMTVTEREKRRLEGGRLLLTTTLSKAEIARRLGVTRSAVTQWAKQIQKRRRGLKSLHRRQHTGRPPRLTKANWRHLLALLRRGATAAGFTTNRWTLARIQQLVQCEYGVSYSKSYLAEKLYMLGWPSKESVPEEPIRRPVTEYKFFTGYYTSRRRGWRSGW
jgi:transposase